MTHTPAVLHGNIFLCGSPHSKRQWLELDDGMDESAVVMFVDFSVSIEFAVPSDWIVQWWTAWNLGIYYESQYSK